MDGTDTPQSTDKRHRVQAMAVLDELATGAVILDRQDRLLYANREARDFLDLDDHKSEAEKAAKDPDFHRLVHGEQCSPDNPCLLREALQRGAQVAYQEDRFYGDDGEPRAVYYSLSSWRDDGQQGAILIFGDIARFRDVQAYLLAMDRMIAVGTLAGGLAHEINNPLAFVQSNIQFVRRALQDRCHNPSQAIDDCELAEALEDACGGLDRMQSIVDSMKIFVDDDEAFRKVDVEQCLTNAIDICRGQFDDVDSLIREGQPLGGVWGNRARLARVFVNLLRNAAQAIEEKGEPGQITVSTGRQAGRQYIEITDDGVGIDEADCKRVFDPFFTITEAGRGTGLGLYISYNFVIAMKGTLTVESTPGQGSTFRVELPLMGDAGRGSGESRLETTDASCCE